MRLHLRFLLLMIFLATTTAVISQDTIRSLVFTEWRGDATHNAYVELTNMGQETLDLSQFTLGIWIYGDDFGRTYSGVWPTRLKGSLGAGETYLITSYSEGSQDWITPLGHPMVHDRIVAKADTLVYVGPEALSSLEAAGKTVEDDSISDESLRSLLNVSNGERGHFLFYNLPNGDSVLVDGVGMVFNDANQLDLANYKDVAGIGNATQTHILVRKFSVKEGNPNWKETRGATPEESQWMPIPYEIGWYRVHSGEYTTSGTHGNFILDQNSVKALADVSLDVDFTNQKITIPWGTRRDSISTLPWKFFVFGDGIAWDYKYGSDSIPTICQDDDVLTLYACGNELQQIDFGIEVAAPTNDMNKVFSLNFESNGNYYAYFGVTDGAPVIDSIINVAFATRVDTLFAHLQKAESSTWKIEFVDSVERADLVYGDKLIVTAENGSEKEYFIAVEDFVPSSNAYLSAITWPDIPTYLKGNMGWTGDTIPGFNYQGGEYFVTVPYGVNKVPALTTFTWSNNATLEVERAISLTGSLEDRTTTFNVTAQDDSTTRTYKVTFVKEVPEDKIQPFNADPFFSQVIRHAQFANYWVEIYNPGNKDLDLSQYMIVAGVAGVGQSPSDIISKTPPYKDRYTKFVPGYKVSDDETTYNMNAKLQTDLSVDPDLAARDVWVLGCFANKENWRMPHREAVTDFHLSPTVENAWGITYGGISPVGTQLYRKWPLYLFKIVGDSITDGLKEPNDPKDFELVDAFGPYPNSEKVQFNPDGQLDPAWKQGFMATRKDTVWKGNPSSGGSFASTPEESEWTDVREQNLWSTDVTSLSKWDWCTEGLSAHSMQPVTVYMSTVKSLFYLVSDGYEGEQGIDGIDAGTTVEQLNAKIIKADENQYLKVIATADGAILEGQDALSNNDTLVVTSADSVNVTKYVLDVGDPLDNNAELTSDTYTITIDGASGTVEGVQLGTAIKTVLESIEVPGTATLYVLDDNGALVSLMKLNSDTTLIPTIVRKGIYFEVIAQNGSDKILYELIPDAMDEDAIVLSETYLVNQALLFIDMINDFTAVEAFMQNLYPVNNATLMVFDKNGLERTTGYIAYDDMLQVTSEDNQTVNLYYLGFKGEAAQLSSDAYIVSDVYDINQTALTVNEVLGNTAVSDFISNVILANGASMKITDASDAVVNEGMILESYKIVVTSENEEVSRAYSINVALGTEALVESDVYTVDQNNLTIGVVPSETSVSDFISNLTPSYGASIKIKDLDDVEVTDGMMYNDYKVVVTSEDELASNTYAVLADDVVSVSQDHLTPYIIYPNPISDYVQIDGLKSGDRIAIYDVTGRELISLESMSKTLKVSLDDVAAGMLFIKISENQRVVFTSKIVKK